MYSPAAISAMPPMTSNVFEYLENGFKFSSQPIAHAPKPTGIERPIANANSNAAPSSGEPAEAAPPNRTSKAGVQNGQTATEKTMPNVKAPQTPVTRRARTDTVGSGNRVSVNSAPS